MNQGVYFGQVIIGPAGSGKSTYCHTLQELGDTFRRNILVVNLDPAADTFKYRCDIDIRDLITLDDVMEELKLGPNGGLVYCMEYILENLEWLQEQLGELSIDDYVLFDCPGQIELYTHLDVMNRLCASFQKLGFSLCSMYMLDTTFMTDNAKFISGSLMSLSATVNLGLPHLTILTKCDLVSDKEVIEQYLEFSEDMTDLPIDKNDMINYNEDFENNYDQINEDRVKSRNEESQFQKKYRKLHNTMKDLLDSFKLVSLKPLDLTNEDSIRDILSDADLILQYGDNVEPNEKVFQEAEKYLNFDNQNMQEEY